MATYNKFNAFSENIAEKVHDLGTDALKVILMTSATSPTAADTVYDDAVSFDLDSSGSVEIAAGNGYSQGGAAVTVTTSAQSGGTYTLDANDVTFTASGGTMATFQYIVLYNSAGGSSGNRPVIAWFDNGSTVSLADTQSFTIAWNASGIFTLA